MVHVRWPEEDKTPGPVRPGPAHFGRWREARAVVGRLR